MFCCTSQQAVPTSKQRAESWAARPLSTRLTSPMAHTTTPNAISSMLAVTPRLNLRGRGGQVQSDGWRGV